MYRNFVAGLLLFVLSICGAASTASAVTLTLADYQDDYQASTVGQPTTTPGWQYLWNGNGGVGNSGSYTNLTWSGTQYTNNGGALPGAGDNYASLSPAGGHPGPGTGNSGGFFAPYDRYVLAAYTIQASDLTGYVSTGPFQLTNTSINDSDTNGGNLSLEVYVNNTLVPPSVLLPGNTSTITTFDRSLGNLSVGDTVYVAVGPNLDHGSDGFGAFDFTIQVDADLVPAPEPSTALLLGAGLLGLSIVRRRKAARKESV